MAACRALEQSTAALAAHTSKRRVKMSGFLGAIEGVVGGVAGAFGGGDGDFLSELMSAFEGANSQGNSNSTGSEIGQIAEDMLPIVASFL
jgi:hypothetical protein